MFGVAGVVVGAGHAGWRCCGCRAVRTARERAMSEAYADGSVDPTEAKSQSATTFGADEDSKAESSGADEDAAPVPSRPTTEETRTKARMNAHHIQRFVNQQGTRRARLFACGAARVGERCACA